MYRQKILDVLWIFVWSDLFFLLWGDVEVRCQSNHTQDCQALPKVGNQTVYRWLGRAAECKALSKEGSWAAFPFNATSSLSVGKTVCFYNASFATPIMTCSFQCVWMCFCFFLSGMIYDMNPVFRAGFGFDMIWACQGLVWSPRPYPLKRSWDWGLWCRCLLWWRLWVSGG